MKTTTVAEMVDGDEMYYPEAPERQCILSESVFGTDVVVSAPGPGINAQVYKSLGKWWMRYCKGSRGISRPEPVRFVPEEHQASYAIKETGTTREEWAMMLKLLIICVAGVLLFMLIISVPPGILHKPTVGNMDVGLKVWLSHKEDAKREAVPGPFTVSKHARVQVGRPQIPPLSSREWQIMVEKVNETEVKVSYYCYGCWNERKGVIVD